ncbi:MAG: response regulator [SAR202 cluster bacterium]|nr:response regulator [SAR202 cluster bacterium]
MSLPLYLPVAGLGCAVPRILIVDNREDIRLALAILMEDEGHAAFEGVDGRDVLPLVRKHHPDLILLDLMTPDTDAPGLPRAARNPGDRRIVSSSIESSQICRDTVSGKALLGRRRRRTATAIDRSGWASECWEPCRWRPRRPVFRPQRIFPQRGPELPAPASQTCQDRSPTPGLDRAGSPGAQARPVIRRISCTKTPHCELVVGHLHPGQCAAAFPSQHLASSVVLRRSLS